MALFTEVIRTDGGTQMRAEMNAEFIADMAEIYRADCKALPPLEVFHDGENYWLADGFHRHAAAILAEVDPVECNVRMGTLREAVLFAAGANARHGLRRTNEDKRKAVLTLLKDEVWGKTSDRSIAETVGVSHPFVAAIRQDLQVVTVTTCEDGQFPAVVGRDGKSYRRVGRGQRNDDPEDRILDGEEVQLDEEPEEDELFGNAAYSGRQATVAKVNKYELAKIAGQLLRGIRAGDDGTSEYNDCLQAIQLTIRSLEKWEKM